MAQCWEVFFITPTPHAILRLPLLPDRTSTSTTAAMRGKRSKQYRKLMNQYGMTFGFREPYQVLLDAQIIEDAARFKMDLIGGLERTLHGQVKPSQFTASSTRALRANRNSDKPMLHSTSLQQRTQKRSLD
jgi:hypothetical protein